MAKFVQKGEIFGAKNGFLTMNFEHDIIERNRLGELCPNWVNIKIF